LLDAFSKKEKGMENPFLFSFGTKKMLTLKVFHQKVLSTFFVALGFKLRASSLLGGSSTT
jgi:hypothetical protein